MRSALVVGTHSGFGAHCAAALLMRGWHVRLLLKQSGGVAGWMAGTERFTGDPSACDDLRRAATGVDAIIFDDASAKRGVAPLTTGQLDTLIEMANVSGATLVMHQNVYETAPQRASLLNAAAHRGSLDNPRGQKRSAMLDNARHWSGVGQAQTIVLRHGDLLGTQTYHTPLMYLLVASRASFRLYCPETAGASHIWANLPDVAHTVGRLLELRAQLPLASVFDFEGFRISYAELAKTLQRASGKPVTLCPFALHRPPMPTRLNSHIWALRGIFRNWSADLPRLDESSLRHALCGEVPYTPLPTALIAARIIRCKGGRHLHWAYAQAR